MKIIFKCHNELCPVLSHLRKPTASSSYILLFVFSPGNFSLCLCLILSLSICRGKGQKQWKEFFLLFLLPLFYLPPFLILNSLFFSSCLTLEFERGFSCFEGNSADFTLKEMREYNWTRSSLGVSHYFSQWLYLSSLQVSLLNTKVPSS